MYRTVPEWILAIFQTPLNSYYICFYIYMLLQCILVENVINNVAKKVNLSFHSLRAAICIKFCGEVSGFMFFIATDTCLNISDTLVHLK